MARVMDGEIARQRSDRESGIFLTYLSYKRSFFCLRTGKNLPRRAARSVSAAGKSAGS